MINVFEEEYWRTCWSFPQHKISSRGRIWDAVFDEEVPQRFENGSMLSGFAESNISFRGDVWRLMYATFWRNGWGYDVNVEYRDEDPQNISIFNLLFTDINSGKPRLYKLDERTGLWVRKRGNVARRVELMETGEIFDSVANLAATLNMDRNAIYMCLRGEQRSHLGYTFRYLE